MTYSLSNNCTKNYYNRTLTVQVIVEDVVTWIFLKHSVVAVAFSDSSFMVGHQEGHMARKDFIPAVCRKFSSKEL